MAAGLGAAGCCAGAKLRDNIYLVGDNRSTVMSSGFVPLERGDFKVMIACCAWGNCSRCNADGDKSKRVWWGIADNLSEAFAEHTAKGWRNFDARVEPMDRADFERRAASEEFFARNKPPNPAT